MVPTSRLLPYGSVVSLRLNDPDFFFSLKRFFRIGELYSSDTIGQLSSTVLDVVVELLIVVTILLLLKGNLCNADSDIE